jgi:phenylacetic acid degradation operon negative regulatory protein
MTVGAGFPDQLRRRSVGAPAARSLLLTILGEYVLPRGEPVWQETLVGALVSVGHSPQAARQALARSVRGGWLSTSRVGRRARVSLSPGAASLLETGASRIYSFGQPWDWDGRWLVLILRVPESRREVRHQLRTRLAWAGLGSMGGGVWLTPHVSREAELRAAVSEAPAALATSFVASLGMLGRGADVAAAAWDLDSVRSQYQAFIEDFAAVRPASGEAYFRMQTLLVHAWRKFPFLDPDLPAELLPSGWPRRRAHELFTGRHSAWSDAAQDWFDSLEAGRPVGAARAA